MKIAILGSNSFSGSHMVNYILENTNYEVIGISRSPEYNPIFLPYLYKKQKSGRFVFYQYDVNKNLNQIMDLLDKEKPEIIVNYAAQGEVRTSWKYPEQWFQTNCMALVALTNKLKDKKYIKRYIHISTPEVYGSCSGRIKENFIYQPSTPYAASKAAGDLFLITLAKSQNFPVVLTRAANVYGIHQQVYRIIPRTIAYLKLGKKIQLHGGGLAKRAFIHIKDNCDAVLKIIYTKNPSLVYHLSSNDGLRSIKDIVKFICEKMGHDFDKCVESVEKPLGQDAVYDLDSSKAKTELDWEPRISLQQGIKEVIRWIEDNWKKIQKLPLQYVHKI